MGQILEYINGVYDRSSDFLDATDATTHILHILIYSKNQTAPKNRRTKSVIPLVSAPSFSS